MVLEFRSVWKMPSGGALAPIQMYPSPKAMPLVFFDSVFTVFSSFPFRSTRQALSDFCSPIHQPSGASDQAFGYPSGLLNSLVIFPLRDGTGGAVRFAAAACGGCWAEMDCAPSNARLAPM